MSPFVKFILDHTVLPADVALVAALKAEQTALVSLAQSKVSAGSTELTAVVNTFVEHLSTNPLVEMAEEEFLPNIESALTAELGTVASTDVPTLIAAGIAWFADEEKYL